MKLTELKYKIDSALEKYGDMCVILKVSKIEYCKECHQETYMSQTSEHITNAWVSGNVGGLTSFIIDGKIN